MLMVKFELSAKVTFPPVVSLPTDPDVAPGAMLAWAFTVIAAEIVPAPPSVAAFVPSPMVYPLPPVFVPLTSSEPPVTEVAPL
jgi:hypothetical protein